jgi:hypothetical protein
LSSLASSSSSAASAANAAIAAINAATAVAESARFDMTEGYRTHVKVFALEMNPGAPKQHIRYSTLKFLP